MTAITVREIDNKIDAALRQRRKVRGSSKKQSLFAGITRRSYDNWSGIPVRIRCGGPKPVELDRTDRDVYRWEVKMIRVSERRVTVSRLRLSNRKLKRALDAPRAQGWTTSCGRHEHSSEEAYDPNCFGQRFVNVKCDDRSGHGYSIDIPKGKTAHDIIENLR